MDTLHITITPTNLTPKGQRYEARLGADLLSTSRTPFFAAARVLMERGYSPDAILTMSHAGPDTVSLRGKLGVAAGLTVIETATAGPRLGRYRPHPAEIANAAETYRPRTAVREVPARVAYGGIGAAL